MVETSYLWTTTRYAEEEKSMRKLAQMVACAAALVAVVSMAVPAAFALGFRNPDQDARATGQGEAFVAQADDASAIYYNPAGLTQLHGTQSSAGGYLTFRDVRFNGAAANEEMNDPAYAVHIYNATDFGLEDWRFGFGINIPFGNDVDLGDNSSFRYIATKSNLKVTSYTPTVAYKFNDHFSLGAGLNIYDGQTQVERLVPFSLLFPGLPDGRSRFDGEGQAFGATAGLMWKINEQHTIGVVYRSPFAIDFHGNAIVKRDPTGLLGRSPATAEINFPQSASVGYAFRPISKLKLEVDVEWTNWETLNTVRLHSPNAAIATDPSSQIPFKWQDSFFYEFGTQYEIDEHWTVRGGYIFSENTVPNSTFSPSIPDSNRHVFSVGLGFATKKIGIDLMYQYSLSTVRTVKNSADTNFDGAGDLDGKWKSDGHALMFTSTLKF
jgi:long-chain fatty acid transport protein